MGIFYLYREFGLLVIGRGYGILMVRISIPWEVQTVLQRIELYGEQQAP